MTYKYLCAYHEFGCGMTRTRRTAIDKHNGSCRYAKQFKKWIDLKQEVICLRNEVSRLQNIRGRPHMEIESVDIRQFAELFDSSKELQSAWITLVGAHKPNGVEALLRIFLAKSPRFWKILQGRQNVEVKGFFGGIRTNGEIHEIPLALLAEELYTQLSVIIDKNVIKMGLACIDDEESDGHDFNDEYESKVSITHEKTFLVNSLNTEARRRIVNGPVTYQSRRVQI